MKIKVLLIETGEQLKVSAFHFKNNGQLDFITLDGGRIIDPEQVEISLKQFNREGKIPTKRRKGNE